MQTTEDFLAHYGKKGMRWGVRRESGGVQTSSGSGGSKQTEMPAKRKMSPETKRKIAIGAGVVGAAALITLGVAANSKHQERGKQAAAAQINAFAKRSKWDLAANLPANPPARSRNTPKYTRRDERKDTKLYGDKGQARIQKRMDKGMTLSGSRQREAARQNGVKALRVATGINSAQRRESKDYDRLRRNRR